MTKCSDNLLNFHIIYWSKTLWCKYLDRRGIVLSHSEPGVEVDSGIVSLEDGGNLATVDEATADKTERCPFWNCDGAGNNLNSSDGHVCNEGKDSLQDSKIDVQTLLLSHCLALTFESRIRQCYINLMASGSYQDKIPSVHHFHQRNRQLHCTFDSIQYIDHLYRRRSHVGRGPEPWLKSPCGLQCELHI